MPDFPSMHLQKNLSFSHCNSFDQYALQLLNDCKFSLVLPVENFGIWGACNIRLERCWKHLSSGVLHVTKFEHYSRKTKEKKIVVVLA